MGATADFSSAFTVAEYQRHAMNNAPYLMAGQASLNNLAAMYRRSPQAVGQKAIAAPEVHPSACKCCGSSEYRKHHGRLICSYCRSAP